MKRQRGNPNVHRIPLNVQILPLGDEIGFESIYYASQALGVPYGEIYKHLKEGTEYKFKDIRLKFTKA